MSGWCCLLLLNNYLLGEELPLLQVPVSPSFFLPLAAQVARTGPHPLAMDF